MSIIETKQDSAAYWSALKYNYEQVCDKLRAAEETIAAVRGWAIPLSQTDGDMAIEQYTKGWQTGRARSAKDVLAIIDGKKEG
jgi:hypothetical protein